MDHVFQSTKMCYTPARYGSPGWLPSKLFKFGDYFKTAKYHRLFSKVFQHIPVLFKSHRLLSKLAGFQTGAVIETFPL